MKYEEDYKYHNDMYAVLKTTEMKGEMKEKKQVTVNLIYEGFDNNFISKITNLPPSEIENIRNELKK